jgi:aryl-alcohol dehydrogenase-like predicted oxidoreductase
MGKVYSSEYGQAPIKTAVSTVQDAAKKHGINGHAAALRWTVFHSVLDGKYGDGVVFGASKIKQLHDCLDAIEAGPLPAELADAIGAVYVSLGGSGPAFHM